MSDRLLRCRRLLDGLGLDAVLVTRPSDVRYLSGFRGDDTALLVGADVALIVTDSRYLEQVREEVVDFELAEVLVTRAHEALDRKFQRARHARSQRRERGGGASSEGGGGRLAAGNGHA